MPKSREKATPFEGTLTKTLLHSLEQEVVYKRSLFFSFLMTSVRLRHLYVKGAQLSEPTEDMFHTARLMARRFMRLYDELKNGLVSSTTEAYPATVVVSALLARDDLEDTTAVIDLYRELVFIKRKAILVRTRESMYYNMKVLQVNFPYLFSSPKKS